MTSFEIFVNGEKRVVAGIGDRHGVLSATVIWVRRDPDDVGETHFHVSGLYSDTRDQPKWLDIPVKNNDEVTIRIKEAESADPPIGIRTAAEMKGMELESKIKHYHQLKEELKDYLKS